jgi:hypothetical protein
MSNEIGFRIVCSCGCLSIRIEEPLKASREAIVYCGDCGASRGTVGALRDLAVQRHPEVISSTRSTVSAIRTADEPHHGKELSKRYAELRRLRQQVEIAESVARASDKPSAISRTRAG